MAKIIGSLGACHNFHGGYDMFPQVSWVKRTSQVGTVEPPDGIYACFAIISGEVLPEFKAEDHGIISIIWKKSNTPHEVQHCSLGILGARYLGSFSGCELLNFGGGRTDEMKVFPYAFPKVAPRWTTEAEDGPVATTRCSKIRDGFATRNSQVDRFQTSLMWPFASHNLRSVCKEGAPDGIPNM